MSDFVGKRTAENQLATLNGAINRCDRCALHASKGLGYGNPGARVFILGQNTGMKIQGSNPELVPFGLHDPDPTGVGRSADVLRKILWDCNIRPGDYYVSNAMKCQVKKAEPYMLANCFPWFEDELLQLPRVRLIVATGRIPSQIVDAEPGRLNLWNLNSAKKYFVTSVNHPAFLLYPGGTTEDEYREQWRFVASVMARLDHEVTARMLGRSGDD